jgi:predicted extracellular nuclease
VHAGQDGKEENMKRQSTLLLVAMLLAMLVNIAPAPAQADAPTELFFSEYIEGSSYNKALEIYNGTGAMVDLAAGGYNIFMSFNGGTSTYIINLTGSVADGDVYVVAPTNATDETILSEADLLQGTSWFNGNDAVVLRKNTAILDVIGQIGYDPGAEWGTGDVSTADNTLRRKDTICAGDPDGSNVFDPAAEWDGYANNTFDGLGAHVANCTPATSEPKINEFSASTVDTDFEYVEIYGDPNTDYSAYKILEIEGDYYLAATGTVDDVISLGTTDANDLYLANLPANALENGTITLLLVKDFTGAAGNDLDTNEDGVLDVTPWSAIVDAVAVNDGGASDLTYGFPVLTAYYDGLAYAPGGASRIPDGYDTDAASDWVRNDFDLAGIPGYVGTIVLGEAYNTPGAPNAIFVPPPEACGDPYTPIYDVQGDELTSPLVGTEVAVEGVVVGDFQDEDGDPFDTDLDGFHVQDPTGDGDPTTSDGIFIYAPGGMDVAAGDALRVRGAVSEYNGMTEITASQIWICSNGNSVSPTTISLPVTSVDDFEPYEGMLVTFPQALVISEYFNYDRYGEIVLTSERHNTPTAIYDPSTDPASDVQVAMQAYLLDKITLDDGRTVQNPDPAIHPNGDEFTLDNLFRGGDTVASVTGVIDYRYDLYRIQPTQGADYTPANHRPAQPEVVGGSLKVASFNVLNYFTTIDTGDWICGPSEDMECRGADTEEEFTRQRAKIIAALVAINADIAGLIEIENNIIDTPVEDLVSGLNDVVGVGTYDFVKTGPIGTDAIKVAFIFKPAKISLVGDYAILDSSVDPLFLDEYNRPVLAQTFIEDSTGGVVTVAVNHLKSKGSDCNDLGDYDLGDGAGNCNLTRTDAAQALVDWLAGNPTGAGDGASLIIGDLNSYDKEDPIDVITAVGYTDLIYAYQGEYAYSYVFDGQTGYLDYALASPSLLDKVTGTTVWHINADEPDLIDYDMSFKLPAQDALYAPDPYRSSDHDPVIVGIDFSQPQQFTLALPVIFHEQ